MTRGPLMLATMLVVGLGGCGGDTGTRTGTGWLVEHVTIGDTIVVRTVAGSVWEAPATLVQEVSIGALTGSDEYLLGSIGALAVDASGNVYVFDQQVPALRKYGSDGHYLATFGRKGGGPGEYQQPDGGALAVLPDGRVLLRDPGNARINVYSPEGLPLDSWRIAGGRFVSRGLVVDSAGNVYTQVFGARTGMATFSPAGEPGDTILAPDWDHRTATITARVESASQTWTVPFSPAPRWVFSPLGHMFGGVSDEYRIDVFGHDGRVLRIARIAEPETVAAGERAAAEFRAVSAMRRLQPDWSWNGPPIPNEKPAFRDLYAGQDGRIWVLLHTSARPAPERAATPSPGEPAPPVPWFEPVLFDVFEPDGTYLGEVRAPDGFRTTPPPVFGTQRVWAVVEDELGVQSVVRFGIERGGTHASTASDEVQH
jgi:hypothetical protein